MLIIFEAMVLYSIKILGVAIRLESIRFFTYVVTCSGLNYITIHINFKKTCSRLIRYLNIA